VELIALKGSAAHKTVFGVQWEFVRIVDILVNLAVKIVMGGVIVLMVQCAVV
jgi:hypothetical protein